MISLTTVDNPGWYLEVTLPSHTEDQAIINIDNDTRWIQCFTRDNQWIAAGDETKLVRIFLETLKYFDIPLTPDLEELIPLMDFLQTWYANECDGDWEHCYEVVRFNVDCAKNCRIAISLNDTYWEDYYLKTTGSPSTFLCYTQDAKFIGKGHLDHIKDFLELFKAWIEYCRQLED